MLGDPYVEGHQVEIGETVHKQLERILKQSDPELEVLGFGHSGHGPVTTVARERASNPFFAT